MIYTQVLFETDKRVEVSSIWECSDTHVLLFCVKQSSVDYQKIFNEGGNDVKDWSMCYRHVCKQQYDSHEH